MRVKYNGVDFLLLLSLLVFTQAARIRTAHLEANCVNVNTAGANALKRIYGIGRATARHIRDHRCYSTDEDLLAQFDDAITKRVLRDLIDSHTICVGDCVTPGGNIPKNPANDGLVVDFAVSKHNHAHNDKHASIWSAAECDSRESLPAQRSIGVAPEPSRVLSEIMYAAFKYNSKERRGSFVFLNATAERRAKCLQAFAPHNTPDVEAIPTSSDNDTFAKSIGLCVLVRRENSESVLEYSEYNLERHVPNFVAYKLENLERTYSGDDCRVHWTSVCPEFPNETLKLQALQDRCNGLVDAPFGPTCMNGNQSKYSNGNCPVADDACKACINTRGHMRPVTQTTFSKHMCRATMNFFNVFPSRNSPPNQFDGQQWAAREAHLENYLEQHRPSGLLPAMWVVVGTSKETDGRITSERQAEETSLEVHVPSFVWTAVYDPKANKATGWLCRNGLESDDACFCVDKLSVRELESRVGHRIFPQLEATPGLDLADGQHEEFWEGFWT